jgi:hypothetical protein
MTEPAQVYYLTGFRDHRVLRDQSRLSVVGGAVVLVGQPEMDAAAAADTWG